MRAAVARFLHDCSGTTAVEYAIIGSVISIAIVAAVITIGVRLNTMFGAAAADFN